MKLRRLKYYFMSFKKLNETVKEIGKKLDVETDINMRFKYIDTMFDILIVIINRKRYDKEFMEYVRKDWNENLSHYFEKASP